MPDREGPCQNLEGGKNPKAPGEAVAVAANPVLKTDGNDAPMPVPLISKVFKKRRRHDGICKDLHEGYHDEYPIKQRIGNRH